jgi:hypothetical protein
MKQCRHNTRKLMSVMQFGWWLGTERDDMIIYIKPGWRSGWNPTLNFFHACNFLLWRMKKKRGFHILFKLWSYFVLICTHLFFYKYTICLCVYFCTCNCCRCMHFIQVLLQHLGQHPSLQQEECQQVLSLVQAPCVCSSISINRHTIMFKQAQGECLDELCLVLVVISTYLE